MSQQILRMICGALPREIQARFEDNYTTIKILPNLTQFLPLDSLGTPRTPSPPLGTARPP